MSIKVSEVDAEGYIRFCINYMGVTWFASQEFEQVQYLADHLSRTYPSLNAFNRRDSLLPAFMDPQAYECEISSPQGLELISEFFKELSAFEVIKADPSFRKMMQINSKLEEENNRKNE
jgi:hypothetical protein